MSDLPNDELLSAYLDGETTAAERAQIEQLLVRSPAAQQLLDELRAVRATVQALPRQEVGEDLSANILRLAERRMLTDEPPAAEPLEEAPVPLGRALFRRFTQPRILVWLAITAVMAVMILWNEREQEAQLARHAREIARAPATVHPPLPPSSISAAPEKPAESAMGDVVVGLSTPSTINKSSRSAESAMGDVAASGPATSAKAAAKRPMYAGKATAAPATASPSADSVPLSATPAIIVEEEEEALAAEAKTPSSGGARLGKKAGPPMAGKPKDDAFAAAPKADSKAALAQAAPAPAANKTESVAASSPTASESRPMSKAGALAEPPHADDVLLVECDVSPEAAKKQAFDLLLAANGITWQKNEMPADRQGGTMPNRASQFATVPQKTQDETAELNDSLAAAKAKDKSRATEPAESKTLDAEEKREGQEAADDQLEAVYVEATPAQVEATLAGLAAQPDKFPVVAIQPAPASPSQQLWSRFNRGQTLPRTDASSSEFGQVAAKAPAAEKLADAPATKPSSTPAKAATSQSDAAPGFVMTWGGQAGGSSRLQTGRMAGARAAQTHWAMTQAVQNAPLNQTSNNAFAQRVLLNAAGQAAPAQSRPAGQAGNALTPPAPVFSAGTNAPVAQQPAPKLQAQARAGEAQVRQQQAIRNAQNQRVVFLLRVVPENAAVSAPVNARQNDANSPLNAAPPPSAQTPPKK